MLRISYSLLLSILLQRYDEKGNPPLHELPQNFHILQKIALEVQAPSKMSL